MRQIKDIIQAFLLREVESLQVGNTALQTKRLLSLLKNTPMLCVNMHILSIQLKYFKHGC